MKRKVIPLDFNKAEGKLRFLLPFGNAVKDIRGELVRISQGDDIYVLDRDMNDDDVLGFLVFSGVIVLTTYRGQPCFAVHAKPETRRFLTDSQFDLFRAGKLDPETDLPAD